MVFIQSLFAGVTHQRANGPGRAFRPAGTERNALRTHWTAVERRAGAFGAVGPAGPRASRGVAFIDSVVTTVTGWVGGGRRQAW